MVDAFHDCVRKDYPTVEAIQELSVELNFGPSSLAQRAAVEGCRYRLRHKDRPLMLQLRDGVFTVNLLQPYPGWPMMRQTIIESWGIARDVFAPSEIRRMGLRYISQVPRASEDDRVGDWIAGSDYVPTGVLGSQHSFMSRVEADLGSGNRMIVMLGEASVADAGVYGSIFLDIDRIIRQTLPPDVELTDFLDGMHNEVWRVCSDSITPRLEQLLQEAGDA